MARIKAKAFGDENCASLWWKRVAIHAAKSCVRWQPTVILREWCLPRAVFETPHISFQAGLAIASCMVPLRDSSDSLTPPVVSDTCWAERKLVAVSWTLEIPLNKYTEELLDEIYMFNVDVSSAHAFHASAVSAELRTRFAELRQVASQFRERKQRFTCLVGCCPHSFSKTANRTPSIVNTTLINCMSPAIPPSKQLLQLCSMQTAFLFHRIAKNMKWKL